VAVVGRTRDKLTAINNVRNAAHKIDKGRLDRPGSSAQLGFELILRTAAIKPEHYLLKLSPSVGNRDTRA
jgi:hypothetical protein